MSVSPSPAHLFPSLLSALYNNLGPDGLRAFLDFAADELLGEPASPESQPEPGIVFETPDLPVNADSETAAVAAWCSEMGLRGSVAGAWIWVADSVPNRELFGGKEALEAYLKAAGFVWSNRRQSWFHRCTVASHATRKGGKLERMHGTAPVGEYREKTFDPRPAWAVQKEQRKARRRARR